MVDIAGGLMSNPWFRMYSEFGHDPKVRTMPERQQLHLALLFCLRGEGKLLSRYGEDEIAYYLQVTPIELPETKRMLQQKGFIDEHWDLLNWNKRQFLSDSSTERVRRYRQGLKHDETLLKHDETLLKHDETDNVTAPDTESDTESDTEEPLFDGLTPLSATPSSEPLTRPEEYANLWNRLRGNLPKVEKFTEERRKKVQARIKSGMTLERFQEAVENCRVKPFLLGDNDRGWTATFDWLVANSTNAEKAITNPYGLNKKPNGNGRPYGRNANSIEAIREYAAGSGSGSANGTETILTGLLAPSGHAISGARGAIPNGALRLDHGPGSGANGKDPQRLEVLAGAGTAARTSRPA